MSVVKGDLRCILADPGNADGVCHRVNVAKNPNASVLCVFCVALNADKCVSDKTDLSLLWADLQIEFTTG